MVTYFDSLEMTRVKALFSSLSLEFSAFIFSKCCNSNKLYSCPGLKRMLLRKQAAVSR